MNSTISKWLFRPSEYVSDFKALFIGLVAILLSGIINNFSSTHFDGVLDVHIGAEQQTSWLFVGEGFINLICISGLLFLSGKIFSLSSIRFIDVIGTQAMARIPLLIVALSTLLIPHQAVDEFIMAKALNVKADVSIETHQVLLFVVLMLILVLMIIWMVVLMYRAFSVSCNLKGAKGIWIFILALLVAESISKYVIYLVYQN